MMQIKEPVSVMRVGRESPAPASLRLQFSPPLSPAMAKTLVQGRIMATISQMQEAPKNAPQNQTQAGHPTPTTGQPPLPNKEAVLLATLQTADGKTLTARLNTPLPEGTQLIIQASADGRQGRVETVLLPQTSSSASSASGPLPASTQGSGTQGESTMAAPIAQPPATGAGSIGQTASPLPNEAQLTLKLLQLFFQKPVEGQPLPGQTLPLLKPGQVLDVQLQQQMSPQTTARSPQLATVSPLHNQGADFQLRLPLPLAAKDRLTLTLAPASPTAAAHSQAPATTAFQVLSLKTDPTLLAANLPVKGNVPLRPLAANLNATAQTTLQQHAASASVTATLSHKPVQVSPRDAGVQFQYTLTLPKGEEITLTTQAPLPAQAQLTFTRPTATQPYTLTQVSTAPVTPSAPEAPQAQATLAAGSTRTGLVQGQLGNGFHSIITTQGETLMIRSQTPLPLGTQVSLKMTDAHSALITQLMPPQALSVSQGLSFFGHKWDALFQALQVLGNQSPSSAEALLRHIPQLGAPFLGQFLSFSEAVAQKDASRLMNQDTLNMLRALGIDFDGDIDKLHLLQRPDAHESGWRSLYFPFMENPQEAPEQGSFHWKNQADPESPDKRNLRFVMQLRLSQFGAMHLDGFLHEKTLLLKLSMKQAVDPAFLEGLKAVAEASLGAYGLQGGIELAVVKELPLLPPIDHEERPQQWNVTV